MHTILVPTDFKTESEWGLAIASSIARDLESELIVLHVIQPSELSEEILDDGELSRDSTQYRNCWNQFQRLKPLMHQVNSSLLVKVGQLVETICEVAANECCDLIVMAASRKSYLQRQIYGSIPESVARQSMCPIACLNLSSFLQEPRSILDGLRQRVEVEVLRSSR